MPTGAALVLVTWTRSVRTIFFEFKLTLALFAISLSPPSVLSSLSCDSKSVGRAVGKVSFLFVNVCLHV
jgi:hypothetical protein